MNDQYGNDWDGFFKAIEEATPPVTALGITDYFTLRTYKTFLARRVEGQLPGVELVFPNIELRLTTETRSGKGINLHLLVSPEDADHVATMEEKLARLTFPYLDQAFPCTDDGLRRLGRAQPGKEKLPDEAALKEGASQFKIELSAVRELFEKDFWVRTNVLMAVAAGDDGLAGISKDSGFRAHREELGRKAHIVFSGSPADRTYWLGGHRDFTSNKQTPKPCLHGSDAHVLARVLQPDKDRHCWIRGSGTFESLRQTLVEPERRVFIGAKPPGGAPSSEVIAHVHAKAAPWMTTPNLELNSGLVTIIGAKGSGKTALADLVALAAGAEEVDPGTASFLGKARQLLQGVTVLLSWADGMTTERGVRPFPQPTDEPRVQYLSQQFVDRLSAPEELGEPLVAEIERVVYSAIPDEERLQTSTFAELRDFLLQGPRAAQSHERDAIREQTGIFAAEQDLERSLQALRATASSKERERKGLESEIAKLAVKGTEEKAKAVAIAASELQQLREAIAASDRRAQEIKDVADETQRQQRAAESDWGQLKARYGALLDEATWSLLHLRIDPTAVGVLARLEHDARLLGQDLKDRGLPSKRPTNTEAPPRGLSALIAEHGRLAKELGLDEANSKRRVDLERRLATAKLDEVKAAAAVAHAEGATKRRKESSQARSAAYRGVFEGLTVERAALEGLYAPLSARVKQDPRLSKLEVVVARTVDLPAWAARGESLLDLRTAPFAGRGSIESAARSSLLGAWLSGTPDQVQRAMSTFIDAYFIKERPTLLHGATWPAVGEWLFATDHIRVRYSIEYEGVAISSLSPGTRGVVLLTLYLALDQWDLRPLVIDQPEENLDPSSVYGSLVPFFREAAERRQIIMVTHNANLVVNTDSDQVIVAEAKRGSPRALPRVTYVAGGLEDPSIRDSVCRLLEGGKDAFRKRGERYGLRI